MKHWALIIGFGMTLAVCPAAPPEPASFDPDNAAHWYRKAFALYEEPNNIDLDAYIDGEIELSAEIEQFVKSQQPAIGFITKATQIEYCDWEFDPCEDPNNWYNPILLEARNVSYLLLADARHNGDNAHTETMLIRIDTVLKISQRIDSGEGISHLSSMAIRARSYDFIRNYLNRNTDIELETLYSIQNLLLKDASRKYTDYIDHLDFQIKEAECLLNDFQKKYLIDYPGFSWSLNLAENTVNKDFYHRNLIYCKNYTRRFQDASQRPYPIAYAQMREIEKELEDKRSSFIERFEGLPNDYKATQADCDYTQQFNFIYTMMTDINPIAGSMNIGSFNIEIRFATLRNALNTGIQLLIKYKETGKLPNTLGPEYPKDLFSNKPFLLTKSAPSFILKCQEKEKSSYKIAFFGEEDKCHEYEFKLPKK